MHDITDRVNLLICTNAKYLQHVAVCLSSLLFNNPNLHFKIVVVSRLGETLDEPKVLRSLAFAKNHSVSFREFSPPTYRVLPLNPRGLYTLDIWTRLWVAEFFEEDVDRVLYMDCDIVVVGQIASLWHTDLEGALLGAVDIPGSQRGIVHLDMRIEDGYFNSGVLLFDLEQWRRTRALDTVLDYVSANLERLRLRDPDQDALNACFATRRKRLDYKWNLIRPFYRDPPELPLPRAEIARALGDARIIHYNGYVKPWSYFSDHPRKAEYWKYLRMTEWHDFVPADRTAMNVARKAVSALLPKSVKDRLKSGTA